MLAIVSECRFWHQVRIFPSQKIIKCSPSFSFFHSFGLFFYIYASQCPGDNSCLLFSWTASYYTLFSVSPLVYLSFSVIFVSFLNMVIFSVHLFLSPIYFFLSSLIDLYVRPKSFLSFWFIYWIAYYIC